MMNAETPKADPTVEVEQFGKLPDGTVVLKYTLKNGLGAELEVIEYGGSVRSLKVPGPDGQPRNIIVGPDTLEGWIENPYYGALIGRVGNRIAHGVFTLEGKTYTLATNNAPGGIPCALHGGEEGFNARLWKIKAFFEGDDACIRMTLDSPDGDQGYPGNVHAEVIYALTPDNTWRICYHVTTDAVTPVSMTQHAYFNLKGCAKGDILDHELVIDAARYTPVNAGLIPTGELAPVAGTPFDFTQPRLLGKDIDAENDQIQYGAGYDHNFVLDHADATFARAARCSSPDGMVMEVWTDQPGMQVYTGNYIPDGMMTPEGPTVRRGGVAFETQHFADSVNRPEFPTVILRPGETLRSVTEYRFPKA
jgi:aldose 1-epimerase